MSDVNVEKEQPKGSCVTLLVDDSVESQQARALLEESGVRFVVLPSDRMDAGGEETALPAVYVPTGSRFNGNRSMFRGMREIRMLFLPRFRSTNGREGSGP